MIEGPAVVAGFKEAGITHVVWIPDSELGTWDAALSGPDGLPVIRVCREGEAFAVAAGLILGGKKPIVIIQCTGLFEAGDALRNVVHDMGLPIFMIVGVRSYYLHQAGKTKDSCPVFTEPILKAWQIPYQVLNKTNTAEDVLAGYRQAQKDGRAGAVLIAE